MTHQAAFLLTKGPRQQEIPIPLKKEGASVEERKKWQTGGLEVKNSELYSYIEIGLLLSCT